VHVVFCSQDNHFVVNQFYSDEFQDIQVYVNVNMYGGSNRDSLHASAQASYGVHGFV